MNVNYTKGGELQYRTVTFFGFVGLITGVRPGVFSFSMNERFGADGGYIGTLYLFYLSLSIFFLLNKFIIGLFEWILNINRNQAWTTLIGK